MDVLKFKNRYPEFENAPPATVEACIAEADRGTSDSWLGGRRDDAVGLLAAHLLASSPQGRDARLMNKDGTTIYETRLAKIMASNMVGKFRIA